MTYYVGTDSDLSFVGRNTHLWRVASMSTWHTAIALPGGGLTAPCGAGRITSIQTLAWRGGMLADPDEVPGLRWCARCRTKMTRMTDDEDE